MLVKTVKYIDYDNNPQKDTLYFNMTKAEIGAFQVRMDGKFIDHLKDLVQGNKIEELFWFFRDFVLDAYGEKSSDGKRFYKTEEARKDFECSIAFSELFTDLMTDPNKVREFTRAILPPDFQNIDLPDNVTDSDVTSVASLPSTT